MSEPETVGSSSILPKPEDNATKELLQTLHAASLTRWENRREHEWKLNYAFWTPIVGLIALILTKHLQLQADFARLAVATLVVIGVLGIQFLYLWPVTDRAICEIALQFQVELAMRNQLDADAKNLVTDDYLAAGWKKRQSNRRDIRYGAYAPLAVTLVILLFAVFSLFVPFSPAPDQAPSKAPHTAIEGF